jgi:hypothetical protein
LITTKRLFAFRRSFYLKIRGNRRTPISTMP